MLLFGAGFVRMSGMHMEGADPAQATTAAGLQPLLSYQQHLALPAWLCLVSDVALLQTCVHYILCHLPAPLAILFSDACFTFSRSCCCVPCSICLRML